MQWQQKQVEKYCRKYGLEEEQYQLPNATANTVVRQNLFRHLLFDDKRHLIFCFIPKVKNCMCTRVSDISGLWPSELMWSAYYNSTLSVTACVQISIIIDCKLPYRGLQSML